MLNILLSIAEDQELVYNKAKYRQNAPRHIRFVYYLTRNFTKSKNQIHFTFFLQLDFVVDNKNPYTLFYQCAVIGTISMHMRYTVSSLLSLRIERLSLKQLKGLNSLIQGTHLRCQHLSPPIPFRSTLQKIAKVLFFLQV